MRAAPYGAVHIYFAGADAHLVPPFGSEYGIIPSQGRA